ncbi:MAG: DUF6078 family protein [Prevotella sp.]
MKKTTKIYKDIPAGYPLCLHNDCPMADTCLRQLAYRRHWEKQLRKFGKVKDIT